MQKPIAKTHVIVNPNAAGRRTLRRWPGIKSELDRHFKNFSFEMTERPFDGEGRARRALKQGAELIIAVGGDGTFSELSNGFFEDGALVNPDTEIAFVTSGTGCDIRRAYGWPEPDDLSGIISLIASGKNRTVDVGRISFTNRDGAPDIRHFVNVTSFGVGGAISNAVNSSKIAKWIGGPFTFYFHALSQGLRYKNQKVRIQIDDHFDEEFEIILAVAALCPYFGGGMKIAPEADPEDGLFDFLIGHDITSAQLPSLLKKIYSGDHVADPNVITLRGKRLVATPLPGEKPILLEVDGESPGSLASTFDILPRALKIRG
jgi:diacylglycerol kinase (ATP)